MSDNLNIDFHIKNTIIKAIKKTLNDEEAAAELGVSKRTLVRLKAEHGITDMKRITVKLDNLDGYMVFTKPPSKKLVKAIKQMVELAFNNM